MSSESESAARLIRVDFGSIDGLRERKLDKYFVDFDYWKNIVKDRKMFVVGRKGSGKTALYRWLKSTGTNKGVLVANLSFSDFPYEKLLSLSDDSYDRPNQYQSIWKYLILSELARLIVSDARSVPNEYFMQLKGFIELVYGDIITDLYKRSVNEVEVKHTGIDKSLVMKRENGSTTTIDSRSAELTEVNKRLHEVICSYLKIASGRTFLVQFDQLDDNYNRYQDFEKYIQSIISLFKTLYSLNCVYETGNMGVHIIAYLRKDIYDAIPSRDAESAKWDSCVYHMKWTIRRPTEIAKSRLLQVVTKRINASLKMPNSDSAFGDLFDASSPAGDIGAMKYICDRSFYRPRDVLQFCIKLQDEVNRSGTLDSYTWRDAEEQYSQWFFNELQNEINTKIFDMSELKKLLRDMATKRHSYDEYLHIYEKYKDSIKHHPQDLAEMLYKYGVLENIDEKGDMSNYYSILLSEQSEFNPNLLMCVHRALRPALASPQRAFI
jgi:hypothetical protein